MRKFHVSVNGTNYEVEVEEITGAKTPAPAQNGTVVATELKPAAPAPAAPAPAAAAAADGEHITAPMPGNILSVAVKAGDAVKKGQVLMILEAMKMEYEIMAPADGTVQAVHVTAGNTVDTGAMLVTLS